MGKNTNKVNNLPRRRSDNFRDVYANMTNIVCTDWEMQLIFSKIGPSANIEEACVTEEVLVNMTFKHAKALHALLESQLKQWEQAMKKASEEEKSSLGCGKDVTGK